MKHFRDISGEIRVELFKLDVETKSLEVHLENGLWYELLKVLDDQLVKEMDELDLEICRMIWNTGKR